MTPSTAAGRWTPCRTPLPLSAAGQGAILAIVVGGFALAARSTVGVLVPPAWWQATVAVSAVASAVLLVLFFEPQLALGLGIDAFLLAVVATAAWTP